MTSRPAIIAILGVSGVIGAAIKSLPLVLGCMGCIIVLLTFAWAEK